MPAAQGDGNFLVVAGGLQLEHLELLIHQPVPLRKDRFGLVQPTGIRPEPFGRFARLWPTPSCTSFFTSATCSGSGGSFCKMAKAAHLESRSSFS